MCTGKDKERNSSEKRSASDESVQHAKGTKGSVPVLGSVKRPNLGDVEGVEKKVAAGPVELRIEK